MWKIPICRNLYLTNFVELLDELDSDRVREGIEIKKTIDEKTDFLLTSIDHAAQLIEQAQNHAYEQTH